MNLARVEYYFSEFLSKVEMRRNVDLSHRPDYRMVSTEIYPGGRKDEELGIEKTDPPTSMMLLAVYMKVVRLSTSGRVERASP